MNALSLTTETIQVGGKSAAVVALVGYLDTYTAPEFMITLEGVIDQGAVHVVVDMTDLDYMGSSGFGILAGANRRVASQGGKFVIAGLSEKLKIIFESLGLTALITTVADRQAAMDALQ